jgi:uncharacterized protein (DUF1697 family)
VTDLATQAERETLISAVKLSAEAVDGLFPEQIKLMRATVVDVNQALNVSGNAFRSAMQDLVTLKSNIGHGNWRAFLKSGSLNISEKSASDLTNAHEKWIGTEEGKNVKDYVLSSMTPRTLAAVANAPNEVRNEVQSKVISGSRVTEAEVRKMIGSKKRRTPEQKALTEALKDISSKAGKEERASFAAEQADELRLEAENYQKVAFLVTLVQKHLEELKECGIVNFESEFIKSYESKLLAAGSKKVLDRDVMNFQFLSKGLELPEYETLVEKSKKLK